jgi:hypothetical protein
MASLEIKQLDDLIKLKKISENLEKQNGNRIVYLSVLKTTPIEMQKN